MFVIKLYNLRIRFWNEKLEAFSDLSIYISNCLIFWRKLLICLHRLFFKSLVIWKLVHTVNATRFWSHSVMTYQNGGHNNNDEYYFFVIFETTCFFCYSSWKINNNKTLLYLAALSFWTIYFFWLFCVTIATAAVISVVNHQNAIFTQLSIAAILKQRHTISSICIKEHSQIRNFK